MTMPVTPDDILAAIRQERENQRALARETTDLAVREQAISEAVRLGRTEGLRTGDKVQVDPSMLVGRRVFGDTPFYRAGDEAAQRNEIRGSSPDLQDPDPEAMRILAQLAVSGAVAWGTGGMSLPVQVGAQAAAGAATEFGFTGDPVRAAEAGVSSGVATGLTPFRAGRAILGAGMGALVGMGVGEEYGEPLVGAGVGAAAGLAVGSGGVRYARQKSMDAWRHLSRVRGKSPVPFATSGMEHGSDVALEVAGELGIVIPPGNLVNRSLVDIGQGIAETSVIAGALRRNIGTVKEANRTILRQHIDDAVARLPKLTREQAIGAVQGVVQGRVNEVRGLAQVEYRAADVLLKSPHPVTALKTAAKEIVEEARTEARAVSPIVRKVAFLEEDDLTVEQIHGIRSTLRTARGTPMPGEVIGKTERDFARLADVADDLITKAGQGNVQALAHIKTGDAIWGEELRGKLGQKFIQKIATTQPEDMVDALLVRGNPGDMRRVSQILTDVEGPDGPAMQGLQGVMLRRIMDRASNKFATPGGGTISVVSGQQMLDEITKLEGQDMALVKEWFPDGTMGYGTLREWKRYAQTLAKNDQLRAGRGDMGVWFNLMQASAVGGIAGGIALGLGGNWEAAVPTLGASAVFLLSPIALNKIYTNARMMRWMTVGAGSAPGSKTATRSGLIILSELIRNPENFQTPKEYERAVNQVDSWSDQLGVPKKPDMGAAIRMTEEERGALQGTAPQSTMDYVHQRVREKREGR